MPHRRKESACLHFRDAIPESVYDHFKVLFRMRGSEETRESFLNVHAFRPEMIVEQACESLIGREAEGENRPETLDAGWYGTFFEEYIEAVDQAFSFGAQIFLQLRPSFFQMVQNSPC